MQKSCVNQGFLTCFSQKFVTTCILPEKPWLAISCMALALFISFFYFKRLCQTRAIQWSLVRLTRNTLTVFKLMQIALNIEWFSQHSSDTHKMMCMICNLAHSSYCQCHRHLHAGGKQCHQLLLPLRSNSWISYHSHKLQPALVEKSYLGADTSSYEVDSFFFLKRFFQVENCSPTSICQAQSSLIVAASLNDPYLLNEGCTDVQP